jgi:hypothetical protein
MKIVFTAHTIAENGRHIPGDVIEIHDAAAEDYINRGLALKYEDALPEKAAIETPEDQTAKPETATTSRSGKR